MWMILNTPLPEFSSFFRVKYLNFMIQNQMFLHVMRLSDFMFTKLIDVVKMSS